MIRLNGGYSTDDPRLDRVPQFDERSKAFPVRALVEGREPRSYSWRHIQLNQFNEGACTGFSATMEAAARPKPVFGDPVREPPDAGTLNGMARQVYYRAKQLDQWEGEAYEGSSVLGATKAGMERGWWGGYRWALGPGAEAAVEDVILAVGYLGPVMAGTWWWSGMYDADSDGYLHPTGRRAGGHAYLLTRYSRSRDALWTPNSWGGQGQGWVRRADLVRLMDEDGEATIPLVRLMPGRVP